MDVDDLSRALREITDAHWADNQRPVFLSALPKELLQRIGGDYKAVLGEESLKTFIGKTSGNASGYKLVEHPTQHAKLGVVPVSVEFEFELEEAPSTRSRLTREDVQAFARVLQSFSADERKAMALPATAVARLLLVK